MRRILVFIAFLSTSALFSQKPVTVFEDDMIRIDYTVLEVKKKGEMLGEIRLIVTNKTEHYVLIDFKLSIFYEMTFSEQTMVEDLCVGPGKVKKGRIRGLFYQPENLTYAQLISDDTEIEIDDTVVTEEQKCK